MNLLRFRVKADVAGDVHKRVSRLCYRDTQCYCILQCSEYGTILGAQEAQFKIVIR